jgi:hypothetical protein
MLEPPFDIIYCSCPRPIEYSHNYWTSDPEWGAPCMPMLPESHRELVNDELCGMINWWRMFKRGQVLQFHLESEMASQALCHSVSAFRRKSLRSPSVICAPS